MPLNRKALQKRVAEDRAAVDRALDRYLSGIGRAPARLVRAMRYGIFSGGKRIRPVIVIEAFRACAGARAGRGLKAAFAAAAAVECVHTYSLIHDDLPAMDDDDYRRGKPTCHKAFGEAHAILAGDALLTLAFAILAENLEPRTAARAAAELAGAIGAAGMAGGQSMDIEREERKATRGALDLVNRLKTGRLFEASAKLGAIVAGANKKKERAMAAYGAAIGEAFQIVDDCLDDDGYAVLIGRERARGAGFASTRKAQAALAAFGDAGAVLAALADHLASRIR